MGAIVKRVPAIPIDASAKATYKNTYWFVEGLVQRLDPSPHARGLNASIVVDNNRNNIPCKCKTRNKKCGSSIFFYIFKKKRMKLTTG